jgi:HK97 family phage major capsid protein
MSEDLTQVIDELGRTFGEFKATHEREIAEIKSKGVPDPVTTEKLGKIEKGLDAVEALKKRLETLEVKLDRPNDGGDGKALRPEEKGHVDAFNAWLRNPNDAERKAALAQAQAKALSHKTVSSATSSAGFAIPESIGRDVAMYLQQESPMRRVLNVITVGTSDYKELVDVNGEASGWVGETDARSSTGTPVLEEASPTFGEVYAYPQIYEHVLDDAFFDVQGWVTNRIVAEFARREGEAWISGNGTKKPTGFLNGTPEATGDFDSPARAFQTLEYVPTGVAYAADAPFGVLATASPTFYPHDIFMDTIHKMRPGYRPGAVWVMNTLTKGAIRKLKDNEGNYLLRPGLEMGEGSQMLGYTIEEMDHMPDMGANAFPIAFGNFREGYLAVERTMLRITVDDNITSPGSVKFYARRRVGGIVKNDQAIKLIKMAAS